LIHIVLTRRYAYTVSTYLASSIGAHAGPVQALPYQDLFRRSELARGTYVLTDFDRLSESLRGQVEEIAGVLDSHGVRRLNRPAGWLSRRELLERLHAEGINPFRAFRLDDLPGDVRYPVFLRLENDHRGVRSGLLNDRAEIDAAATRFRNRHRRRKHPLVVEFSDTMDESGRYRKYGAFCIGGDIIPRHVFFGHAWMLKHPVLHGERELEEEWAYVQANPHADQIREVFALAGVEYGRMDYAVVGDRIRVWEINTNPMIATPDDLTNGARAETAMLFAQRLKAAWASIDTQEGGSAVPLPPMRKPLLNRLRVVRDAFRRWT
jgi:hypothetical protein